MTATKVDYLNRREGCSVARVGYLVMNASHGSPSRPSLVRHLREALTGFLRPRGCDRRDANSGAGTGGAAAASAMADPYAHLYRKARLPVLVLSARDLSYADCNEAALAALRCESKGEVVGRNTVHFSPAYQPDGRGSVEKAAEVMARVLRSRTARCDWIHRRKDGTEFAVEAVLSRISVGREALVYVRWFPAAGAEGEGAEVDLR